MKHLGLRSIIVMAIIGLFSSCNEDEINKNAEPLASKTRSVTQLGRHLQNPYSVENMRKAYSNLRNNSNSRIKDEDINIETTHLYIKFKPKSENELSILKSDTTIVLFEYPLDYELVPDGPFYHDPEVPVGQPTYRYASIPSGKKIPEGVAYEILAPLFIPDDESDISEENMRTVSTQAINELVEEALRITNNLESDKNGRTAASSWKPAGTIRVWDDVISAYRPVEGVPVKARRWFTTHEGNTNAAGYYSCNGTFKRDANYSLDWERYNFALREGWLDGANINGPKKEGNWNLDLASGANMLHARVFMAAYHYYYKEISGLRRPPQNATLKTQMHIRVYNESNDEANGNHNASRRVFGLGSAIKIYNNTVGRTMQDLYGTTIHELGHASHWSMDSKSYNNGSDIVLESWARGVQWELTRKVYPGYAIIYGRKKGFGVNSTAPYSNYTGICQDMIDGINVNDGDRVEGYSIRQAEDALIGQTTWTGWRNNIINKYTNATENQLSPLFDYWN